MQQHLTILAGLLATASAASAASIPRQEYAPACTINEFHITDLQFSGSPHSVISYYNLRVTDSKTSANCSATTSTGPYLSVVPWTACRTSDGSKWSWSFSAVAGEGYLLNIGNHVGEQGLSHNATRLFPMSDFVIRVNPNPNGNVQYLNTSSSLLLPYISVPLA